MSEYGELLKHPKWQRRRLEIMLRADFKCEHCYADERQLHVHHKKYVAFRKPWEYADDELVCLCEVCHSIEHDPYAALATAARELTPEKFERLLGYALGLAALSGARVVPVKSRMLVGVEDLRDVEVHYSLTDEHHLTYWAERIAKKVIP